ncbi:MAG: DUF721 domain-containing protein [Gammaproteobacteria bacterium]|nr:DUF721 domain-containing protein [Gammaproteobacteria bacterium]MYF02351.1 DUF721 domain-containing protein [Gammaproteobacteria bacterium]MYI77900.1 DUF721 domain-containing protein [Gammaproteobacteria bacterium]
MNYYRLKDSLVAPDKRFSKLARIIKELDAHQATIRVVRFLLPEEEASHCTGARVQGNTVFVSFDSNAWANRARFQTSMLLEQMQELAQFSHVKKIVVNTNRGNTSRESS